MRTILASLMTALLCATALARDTAIYNGKLMNALNANGCAITNLPAPTASGDAANKAYVDAAVGVTPSVVTNIAASAAVTNMGAAAYADAKDELTKQIVYTWEQFLDGSNVVFSITNYISGSYNLDAAKLRIMEMTNGVYREVYNSRDEINLHVNYFKTNDFRVATNQVITTVNTAIAAKADKAWGQYTSAGGEAPSNTVYMTAPNTIFAGGMEYERVAVGEGTVCVLTTKGAPVWTQGDEGTFKFQDDGGTNYFGFAKTDSYVIGCNTDGISVSGGLVTLTYNVTMSGVPCIWYNPTLTNTWEQLNLPDGTAVSGASHVVAWEQTPAAGTEVCSINCTGEAKGFFKATIEVAGEAKFMTNMPADLMGGILCTNGEDAVVAIRSGNSIYWQTTDGTATSGGGGSSLAGYTADFNYGTNFTLRVYNALTNVIYRLGGSVTNVPAFN